MGSRHFIIVILSFITLLSFSSSYHSFGDSKKLKKAKIKIVKLDSAYKEKQLEYVVCKDTVAMYAATINALREQVRDLRESNSQLSSQVRSVQASNDQLLSRWKDLSVISSSQAESIKKSLENIGSKDAYIKELQAAIARKDSMTMALVVNLKSAIGNLDDKDINIKIDKGVVYVDISDKMLFKSGKYEVAGKAKDVLGRLLRCCWPTPNWNSLWKDTPIMYPTVTAPCWTTGTSV